MNELLTRPVTTIAAADPSTFPRLTVHGRWMEEGGQPGLVSVIVPAYNREAVIADTLRSVWDQHYRPIELIVVDDGSSDGTSDVVAGWIDNLRHTERFSVRLLRQRNAGAQVARNHGLLDAGGEYIQFLDSDDLLAPVKLSRQVRVLEAHSEACCCLPMTQELMPDGTLGGKSGHYPPMDCLLAAAQSNYICIGPLWRRSVIYRAGPWDEELPCRQDWEYGARIVAREGGGIFLPEVLCYHRFAHGPSISRQPRPSYAIGHAFAARKVAATLQLHGEPSAAALNELAAAFSAAFMTLMLAGHHQEAKAVWQDAMRLASGSRRLRLAGIRLAWLIMGAGAASKFIANRKSLSCTIRSAY